ncbi:transmembrane protein 242 [Anoplophora glabripennis]|nr:transmembrane protein 242 [Anoplophora glabripennis]
MEQSVDVSDTEKKTKYSREFKVKAAFFLTGVSGIAALAGFGATLAAARKQDPKYFGKGMLATKELPETGANLAIRALGWGTLYAVTGCGILFYSVWKLSGAKNIEEFRYKVGSIWPKIPKNDPPQGRTEFSGLNDLLEYLQHQKGVR